MLGKFYLCRAYFYPLYPKHSFTNASPTLAGQNVTVLELIDVKKDEGA